MKARKVYAQKSVSQRHERLTPVESGDCGAYVLATWPDGSYGIASATDSAKDHPQRFKRQSDALAAVYAANALDQRIDAYLAEAFPAGTGF